jgi:hypothetical protein
MKVTPEIKQRIKQLSGQHRASHIAKMLGLSAMTIGRHIGKSRSVLQTDDVNFCRVRRQRVREGIFNVHERQNWLV